jgi:tRNA U34 5-carboxymethylaminomethyl modifying GTPase MnmE/TrmE
MNASRTVFAQANLIDSVQKSTLTEKAKISFLILVRQDCTQAHYCLTLAQELHHIMEKNQAHTRKEFVSSFRQSGLMHQQLEANLHKAISALSKGDIEQAKNLTLDTLVELGKVKSNSFFKSPLPELSALNSLFKTMNRYINELAPIKTVKK